MMYGIWGLVDLIQISKRGEKISPELELQIREERLMDPSLSTARMIKKLKLQYSKTNVQLYLDFKQAYIPRGTNVLQKIFKDHLSCCLGISISL